MSFENSGPSVTTSSDNEHEMLDSFLCTSNIEKHDDSEYELPTYDFKSTSTNAELHTTNTNEVESLDYDQVLAQRKKVNSLYAQLDHILEEGEELPPKTFGDQSKDEDEIEDEDVRYILSAKAFELSESTITKSPSYTLLDHNNSMLLFNWETLRLEYFLSPSVKEQNLMIRNVKFDDIVNNFSLQINKCSREVEEALCTFCLYFMSVHPVKHVTEMCYEFLCSKSFYCPSITDFFTIFQNWGFTKSDMYKSIPEPCKDLQEYDFIEKPKFCSDVKDHNFYAVFRYLKYVIQLHASYTFFSLVEPLMRLIFDKNIYDKAPRIIVSQILTLLVGPKMSNTLTPDFKSFSVKDIHLEDMSFQHQTVICTQILRYTQFAVPLGLAALGQFLTCPDLKYSKFLNLEKVKSLLIEKKRIIEEASYLDEFCCLQILELFLGNKQSANDCTKKQTINHKIWHDLFADWALQVTKNENCADPFYVKQKIDQIQYLLRMKKAMYIEKHSRSSYESNY